MMCRNCLTKTGLILTFLICVLYPKLKKFNATETSMKKQFEIVKIMCCSLVAKQSFQKLTINASITDFDTLVGET